MPSTLGVGGAERDVDAITDLSSSGLILEIVPWMPVVHQSPPITSMKRETKKQVTAAAQ